MAKTKEQKRTIVQDLSDKLDKSKAVVFAKFSALSVEESEELRNSLRQEGGEAYVAKKTLLGRVLDEREVKGFDPREAEGQLFALFGYQDEVAPAKLARKFMDEHEGKMNFVGGILEGAYVGSDQVMALSKLPSKEELYAKIVGSINAPVSGFVNALAGNMRNLVYVLSAIEEKKQ